MARSTVYALPRPISERDLDLMKRMGVEALYRKPKTTKRHPQHRVYPYLLRGLVIDRPNQVFAMDITYIPMARGFVYLVAVLDWYSRKVLSWRVSITMDVHFCLEALEEAIDVHGVPEIVNTDQGSQFTSQAFTGLLKQHGIRISMDGKGAWREREACPRGTMSLSSDCGGRSSTKRFIFTPTTRSLTLVPVSAVTLICTIKDGRIPA